jgi:CheY-like chemotaxis protein
MIDIDGPSPEIEAAHRQQRHRRVLLAETSLRARRLLACGLERDGFEVIAVKDGLEALEALEAFGAPGELDYPDLLVVGLRMAGLGGVAVLEALRLADARTPVLVVSGSADRAAQRRVRDLGCAALFEGMLDADAVRAAALKLMTVGA